MEGRTQTDGRTETDGTDGRTETDGRTGRSDGAVWNASPECPMAFWRCVLAFLCGVLPFWIDAQYKYISVHISTLESLLVHISTHHDVAVLTSIQ